MAGFKQETVVGRGESKQGFIGPVATSSTSTTQGETTYIDTINSRLASAGINIPAGGQISASDAWVQSLSKAQQSELAAVFKKMGRNVRDSKTLATLLLEYPEVTSAADYLSGYKALTDMIIPGAAGGPSVTQTITQYDDKYLQGVGNSIAQDFLGRDLSKDELSKIMPKLKDIVNKGTTTTSKKVGGKSVVTTTPGFSQAKAEGVIQAELRKTAAPDLETKQYIDFADFISKNMAGM